MDSMDLGSGHKSYILRVWQVERDGEPATVATLEDCQTNARQAFPSLAELLMFLEISNQQTPPVASDSQSKNDNVTSYTDYDKSLSTT
jgi:hypothetical protein